MSRPARPTAIDLPGIPADVLDRLVAAAGGDRLALVGGAVRDLLLHRVHNDPWRGVPDLDLVVAAAEDGDVPPAHRLARRLQDEPGCGGAGVRNCQEHGAYGTVELELELHGKVLLLDIASARLETYPVPGENPQVRSGTLADDLARRDFTINAMALLLAGEAGGGSADGPATDLEGHELPAVLLDPHGGQADLRHRRLRFLHPGSVRDDPTRVVRGARYAARMGFELAEESRRQVAATLEAWPWAWRSGDPPGGAPSALGTRLRMELELLLEREAWPTALAALQRWGGLALLDGRLQADRHWLRRLRRAERLALPLLPALLAGAADPLALAERLQLPHRQHRLLAQFLELRRRLETSQPGQGEAPPAPTDLPGTRRRWSAQRWCQLLEAPGLSAEAVALGLAAGLGPRRPLLRWWLRWRHLRAPVAAAELIAQGVRQGPELGERLRQLRDRRLEEERC